MRMLLVLLGLSLTSCVASLHKREFEFDPEVISCDFGSPTKVGVDVYTRADQQIIALSWLCEDKIDRTNYMLGHHNLEW